MVFALPGLDNKAPAAAEASSRLRSCLLLGSYGCVRLGILAAEALDAACGVDQLLLAGKERVAGGADFDMDVALVGGASGKIVAASALYVYLVVAGVNAFFGHGGALSCNPLK